LDNANVGTPIILYYMRKLFEKSGSFRFLFLFRAKYAE